MSKTAPLELIPAIDLRGGRCVRLYQGDFDAETHYGVTPSSLLTRYRAMGAGLVHVVDLDGAKDGHSAQRMLIAELATFAKGLSLALQVGGGVRAESDVQELLALGVARVVVGSTAVKEPALVRAWMQKYGSERIVLAFDVRVNELRQPYVSTHGWLEQSTTSLWDAMMHFEGVAKYALCTDIAKDGALSGPNLALYTEAVTRFPAIAWQASGGIRDAADLLALSHTGVAGAISGRALLEHRVSEKELSPFLPNASSPA